MEQGEQGSTPERACSYGLPAEQEGGLRSCYTCCKQRPGNTRCFLPLITLRLLMIWCAQISRHPGGAAERDVRMEQLVWRVWALKRRHAGVKASKQHHQYEVRTAAACGLLDLEIAQAS